MGNAGNNGGIVFVLGAGFTRAFIPEAPLLTDPYPLDELLKIYSAEHFPHAHKILQLECKRYETIGRFDLEPLMTRLDSSMPHDFDLKVVQLIDQLRHDLYDHFVKRLLSVNPTRKIPTPLADFAKWCIRHQANFVTFNYDDFLDQALWEVERQYSEPPYGKYWHPNSGYGFICPPYESIVQGYRYSMGRSSTLILKLHGSVNWRIKRGASRPLPIDAILHGSPWCSLPNIVSHESDVFERHVEPDHFLVMPVLMKNELTKEPTFRLLWSEAFRMLGKASRVVFIGYSMPRTDIAASCLFGEALQDLDQIDVISLGGTNERSDDLLIASYQSTLPQLTNKNFHFQGAKDWLRNNHFIPAE
jgi:hypothetical protein